MKNLITNKYLKAFLYVLPLLLIFILVFFINRSLGSGFVNVLDSAIFLTNVEAHKKFFTLWTENNLGYINSLYIGMNFFSHLYSLILLKLNLSIKCMELVIYFIAFTGIFYSSWYAFYLIQKRVFNQNSNIFLPFLAAFFYSYNIFSIFLIGIIDQVFLLQVLYPYLLYILITLLDEEINLKYILVLGIIIGFTIAVPIFSVAIYISLLLPFIFFKKNICNIKNAASFILISLLALLLACPLVYALIHSYVTPNPYSNIQNGPIAFIFPPFGIMGVFQFFFSWSIPILDTNSNLYFRSGYGLASSYVIWILILMTLAICWKTIKNKKVPLFLIFALALSMFLCKGGHKPFGEFNMLMYDLNPLFTILRTPSTKFSLPIMLIISTLILYALNLNKNKILTILITVTIIMQTWIFFNPINFTGEKTGWWSKPVVKISQDYKNLISFLKNEKKTGAVIFYPGLTSSHYDLKNGVVFSFQDVLGKYIERPVIYPDSIVQLALAKKNTTKIVKDFNPQLIGSLSIRYIIVRRDFDISRLNEQAEVNRALKMLETKDFKKVFTSKLFTVFEVNNKYFKDLITIKTTEREYAPNFTKIAPYHYVVNTKIRDMLDNPIVFRNNFHPDWKILDLEKKGLKANQILVDNFANGWTITLLNDSNKLNLDQDIGLNIYFYPQKILFYLGYISIISFLIIGSLTIYVFIKENKKKYNIDNHESDLKS